MIKMLNLYRCSSEKPRLTEQDTQYFVADYFDAIKVEDLDMPKTNLAECMGIKRNVNSQKKRAVTSEILLVF